MWPYVAVTVAKEVVVVLGFLSLLFALFGVWLLISQRKTPHERITSRLRGVRQVARLELGEALAESREREIARKQRRKKVMRQRAFTEIPTLDEARQRITFTEKLNGWLIQAQLAMSVPQFMAISFALFLLGIAVSILWRRGLDLPLAALLGLLVGGAPAVFVYFRVRRRLKRFGVQLPDALDLMSSSVKSGQSLNAAIQNVAEEMPDPVAEEFRIVSDELSFGVSFEDSLRHLTARADTPDVRFFSTALMIQKETGGNLSEVLDGLQNTIRERFRIMGQVRTLTAQGKLSGLIVGVLPIVLGILIYFLNRDYILPLFTDPRGQKLILAGLAWQIVGIYLICRIVNIKV